MNPIIICLLWGLLSLQSQADLSPDVEAACSTLHSKYPKQLVWDPFGPKGIATVLNAGLYNVALHDYWNAKSASNRPSCAFFPSNAQQVSFAVETLGTYSSVKFALKSGGHNPNLGFSSVNGGVLIAFRPNSQYAIPAPDGKTVDVGAGSKWKDVYSALQPLGKAAVGGRLGDVGVTGYMLGGGLSYLSAQYGFACDSVLNFECVLANGTIVNAGPASHPDLYFALRGGGNQYAIITKMTLKTYDVGENGQVWGGVRVYGAHKHAELFSAISSFTADNEDPKAAIIPTFEFIGAVGVNIPAIIVFFFYDGTKPANGVFDKFDAVLPLSDGTRVRSYTSLTNEALGGDMKGFRFQIAENTFPNMPASNMSSFLNDHFDMVTRATALGAIVDLIDLKLFSFAIQPMPRGIAQASQDTGKGNALNLQPENGDRIWMQYDVAWASPLCDTMCPLYLQQTIESLHDLHEQKYAGIFPTNYKQGNLKDISYSPIFMNDAMYNQQVLESYGTQIYTRLKSIHELYDPMGFFSSRQNGWKFTT